MPYAAVLMTAGLFAATVLISLYSRQFNQTSAEFYLAGRKIGYIVNAGAICGDYFSAASFLGVAAAIYAGGLDGAWFGAGFGAGFVPVVLFFASPLRRSGEYTLPDFLSVRFQSPAVRIVSVMMVQLICVLYLSPQMLAVGQMWEMLVGRGFAGLSPYVTGVTVTALLMLFYSALGGMRGTTWNQVVQFWVLFVAMAAVVVLGLLYGVHYLRAVSQVGGEPLVAPVVYRVKDLPVDAARAAMSPEYWATTIAPHLDDPNAEVTVLMPVTSKLTGTPMRFGEPGGRYDWLNQFSVVLTLIMGTSSLPHIMNRFYTSRSGVVARITTVYVLVFVGVFYILAAGAGVLGRALIPMLVRTPVTGATVSRVVDGVLANPDAVMPFLAQSLGGDFGLGIVATGAFAAALSTMGGLLIASAASWGHDLYEKYIDPGASERRKVAVGRVAVVLMALVGVAVSLGLPSLGLHRTYPALIALMVTWALGVAGGGFFPVLFLGIWWRRTTTRGALAGMIVGGFGSVLLILANVVSSTWADSPRWVHVVGGLTFPAVVTAPAAFAAVCVISLLDRRGAPANLDAFWARIHGTAKERAEARRIARLSG